MLNSILQKLQRLPQLLIGFLVLSGALLFMSYYDPPRSLCELQMQEVEKHLLKGFYSVNHRSGGFEGRLKTAYQKCLSTNSAGGCLDMFSRFGHLASSVKNLPSECGQHPSTQKVQRFLARGLRLLAMIGWGEKPPENKYNKTAWLDSTDLGLFCRMKFQYRRLYGDQAWKQLAWSTLPGLPGAKELDKRQLWDRGLFSNSCKAFY